MIDIDNLGKRPEPPPPAPRRSRAWFIFQWGFLVAMLAVLVLFRLCSWTLATPPVIPVSSGEVRDIPDSRSGATIQILAPSTLDHLILVAIHPTGRPGELCTAQDFAGPPDGGRRVYIDDEIPFAANGSKYVLTYQGAPLPGKPGRIEVRYDRPWVVGWRKLNVWALLVVFGALYFYGRMLPALLNGERWTGNLPPN